LCIIIWQPNLNILAIPELRNYTAWSYSAYKWSKLLSWFKRSKL